MNPWWRALRFVHRCQEVLSNFPKGCDWFQPQFLKMLSTCCGFPRDEAQVKGQERFLDRNIHNESYALRLQCAGCHTKLSYYKFIARDWESAKCRRKGMYCMVNTWRLSPENDKFYHYAIKLCWHIRRKICSLNNGWYWAIVLYAVAAASFKISVKTRTVPHHLFFCFREKNISFHFTAEPTIFD